MHSSDGVFSCVTCIGRKPGLSLNHTYFYYTPVHGNLWCLIFMDHAVLLDLVTAGQRLPLCSKVSVLVA